MRAQSMKLVGKNEYATVDEATEALAALSDTDLSRLNLIAKCRARMAPGLDWRDLLHSAIENVLDGSRRWPRDLPFLVFLREVMRSLASEYRRKFVNGTVQTEADLVPLPDGESPLHRIAEDRPDPEREIAARQAIESIFDAFREDLPALAVLEGLGCGRSPTEIQKKAGLTPTQYASAQKRIRRSLARTFSEGKPI